MTPEYSASIWSLYNFSWYTRVIDEAYNKELKIEELPVSGKKTEKYVSDVRACGEVGHAVRRAFEPPTVQSALLLNQHRTGLERR